MGESSRISSTSETRTRSAQAWLVTPQQTDTLVSSLGVLGLVPGKKSPRVGTSTSSSTPGGARRAGLSGPREPVPTFGTHPWRSRGTDRSGSRMNQSPPPPLAATLLCSTTTERIVTTTRQVSGVRTTHFRLRQAAVIGGIPDQWMILAKKTEQQLICQEAWKGRAAPIWAAGMPQDTSVASVVEALTTPPPLPAAWRSSSSGAFWTLFWQQRHCTNRPVTTPMSHEWWPFGVLGNVLRLRTGRRMRNGACRKG